MSYYIKIHKWSGQNLENTTSRFAKTFRMQNVRATEVMQDILGGKTWQFEHTTSDEQSDKAYTYLKNLGYQVELVPAVEPQKPVMRTRPPAETLAEPVELTSASKSKKSPFDFLKKLIPAKPPVLIGEVQPPARPSALRRMFPLLFLLLIIAVGTMLPYCFGVLAETKINEFIPQLFQKGSMVQLKSYNRGWLRSNAEYSIKMAGAPPFTLVSEIVHGPFPIEEWMAGNFKSSFFQVRIQAQTDLGGQKADEGIDPLEKFTRKEYFLKKGTLYMMDLVKNNKGLLVNGKPVPLRQSPQ